MRVRTMTIAASLIIFAGIASPSFAQQSGSATGNGTSTPAGPAGASDGKVMPEGAGSGSAMKSGTMMKGDKMSPSTGNSSSGAKMDGTSK